MALQKEFQDEQGIDHPEGYWRAESFCFLGKSECFFQMKGYSSAALAAEGKEYLDIKRFEFVYDYESSVSLNEQAYAVALTDPFFADSTSV